MIGRRAAVSRRGPGSGDGKATRVYAVLAAIGWVIHGWGRGPALCLTSVRLDRGLRVQWPCRHKTFGETRVRAHVLRPGGCVLRKFEALLDPTHQRPTPAAHLLKYLFVSLVS